ncbi:MAG: PAS domain-containing protein [Ramlibacter sp.]
MTGMEHLHSLLRRQLRRHLGDLAAIPPEWQAFIDGVNDAYLASDADRQMMERSLELSSQELVQANAEMRAVFQAIPDLVLRMDRGGTVLDVKAGASHELQVSRRDFVGRPLQDTPLQEAAAQLLAAAHQVQTYNATVSVEYTTRHAEGDTHCEARLLPLESGQIVVIIRDITQRKQAELRVRDDLQTLRRAAEAAHAIAQHQSLGPLLQAVAEQARAVVQAHQCFVSLQRVGDSVRQAGGISLSDKHAVWQDRAGLLAAVQRSTGQGLDEAALPLRLSTAGLMEHPCWRGQLAQGQGRPEMRGWLVTPLKNRQGTTVGYLELSDKVEGEFSMHDQYLLEELTHIAATAIENVGLMDEVRELNADLESRVRERSEALAQQEALFQAAAEQAPQVMWIVNPKGAVTYLNRAWYELVGGVAPKWLGHEWTEAVAPEDVAEMRRQWLEVNQTGGVFSGLRRVHARDGTLHTLSYRASPVRGAQGEVTSWIGMDADITEIKAIEAALRRSNSELEAFSYSVSHDLRSPLRVIDGFSLLLSRQLPPDASEKAHIYIGRIRAGVEQMGQLIESLLALARISHSSLRPHAVDLSRVATDVVARLRAREPERHVVIAIAPGLLVRGDEGFLKIAMENLIANAWKFSSRRADAMIRVGRIDKPGSDPVYFVADNGAGFDMAYADKLFGTFQRLHSASEFPGTGVGLATVKRVIERHEGRVWAESRPDNGATFFFTLPP